MAGVDYQPKKGASAYSIVFFVLVIVLGSFLIMQLFITVVFESYLVRRCFVEGKVLTPAQLDLVEFEQRLLFDVFPSKDKATSVKQCEAPTLGKKASLIAQKVRTTNLYYGIVTAAVVANVVVLMTTFYNAPRLYIVIQDLLGLICAGIFFFELLVEVAAVGFQAYLHSAENCLNFFVCCIAVVDFYVVVAKPCDRSSNGSDDDTAFLGAMRALRVMRLFKLLGPIPSLRTLLIAMTRPLPTLMSLSVLIFMILVTCGNFVLTMFGHFGEDILDRHVNFRTMFNSIASLFYFLTGENYAGVLAAVRTNPPNGCPAILWQALCVVFFVTYVLLMNFLVLNLFIMVVVDSYELVSNDSFGLNQEQILAFESSWHKIIRKYPNQTPKELKTAGVHHMYITESQLFLFFRLLPPDITGFNSEGFLVGYRDIRKFLFRLDLANFQTAKALFLESDAGAWAKSRGDDFYHFHRVLLACNRVVMFRKDASKLATTRSASSAIVHGKVAEEELSKTFAAFEIQHWWTGRRERWKASMKGILRRTSVSLKLTLGQRSSSAESPGNRSKSTIKTSSSRPPPPSKVMPVIE